MGKIIFDTQKGFITQSSVQHYMEFTLGKSGYVTRMKIESKISYTARDIVP